MLPNKTLTWLVIGKSFKSCCFRGEPLPPLDEYHANKSAWMTTTLFEYICKMDCQFSRKVLFIVDNCPVHGKIQSQQWAQPYIVYMQCEMCGQWKIYLIHIHHKTVVIGLLSLIIIRGKFEMTLIYLISRSINSKGAQWHQWSQHKGNNCSCTDLQLGWKTPFQSIQWHSDLNEREGHHYTNKEQRWQGPITCNNESFRASRNL